MSGSAVPGCSREQGVRSAASDSAGGWIWNLHDTPRVLYRLPHLIEAAACGARIFIVEGEKDVEALEAAGAVATCNPGGAGRWKHEYSEHLHGAS